MSIAAYSGAVALATVLASAGAMKLVRPSGMASLLTRAGVRGNTLRMAQMLALTEVFVGLILVMIPDSPIALIGAMAVCLSILGVAVYRLIVKDREDCGCFGTISTGATSHGWHLASSLVLFATPALLAAAFAIGAHISPNLDGLVYGVLLSGVWFVTFVMGARLMGASRSSSDPVGTGGI